MSHQRYDPDQDELAHDEQTAHSRYRTRGGATVIMRPDPAKEGRFVWTCYGCQEQSFSADETQTRRGANEHAGGCHSMP